MILFYTGESIKKTANMNIWNREHVWAQSLTRSGSGQWFGTSGAGADLHHIRPCDPDVNGSRGNKNLVLVEVTIHLLMNTRVMLQELSSI